MGMLHAANNAPPALRMRPSPPLTTRPSNSSPARSADSAMAAPPASAGSAALTLTQRRVGSGCSSAASPCCCLHAGSALRWCSSVVVWCHAAMVACRGRLHPAPPHPPGHANAAAAAPGGRELQAAGPALRVRAAGSRQQGFGRACVADDGDGGGPSLHPSLPASRQPPPRAPSSWLRAQRQCARARATPPRPCGAPTRPQRAAQCCADPAHCCVQVCSWPVVACSLRLARRPSGGGGCRGAAVQATERAVAAGGCQFSCRAHKGFSLQGDELCNMLAHTLRAQRSGLSRASNWHQVCQKQRSDLGRLTVLQQPQALQLLGVGGGLHRQEVEAPVCGDPVQGGVRCQRGGAAAHSPRNTPLRPHGHCHTGAGALPCPSSPRALTSRPACSPPSSPPPRWHPGSPSSCRTATAGSRPSQG